MRPQARPIGKIISWSDADPRSVGGRRDGRSHEITCEPSIDGRGHKLIEGSGDKLAGATLGALEMNRAALRLRTRPASPGHCFGFLP